MWKNFIRVTVRSISKNKAFNAINIAGLAIGLASAIFIILYIISETSYDRFNERSADIYRLYLEGKMAGEEFTGAWVSPIVAPSFHEEIPEVENFCRIDWANNGLIRPTSTWRTSYSMPTQPFSRSSPLNCFREIRIHVWTSQTPFCSPNRKRSSTFPMGIPLDSQLP